jgi:cation transport ATPase
VGRKENGNTIQAHRMHDGEHAAMAAGHEGHGGRKTSGGGHAGHDRHAGHTTGMFRDRFWVSLVLSVPVVLYSDMIQMWFGFSMPRFPGSVWVAPVLGTFIFLWGGWPFLKGGIEEARERQVSQEVTASVLSWSIFGAALDWSRNGAAPSSDEVADQVLSVIVEGLQI